ncbi:RagB/SusD family nutrient uptake outer membrane protein [Olivibacter ginsenosidimutans]
MSKKLFLSALLSVILLGGCNSILDVEQESSIIGNGYWNTPDDVKAYLTGIYFALRDGSGTGTGGVMNTTFWLEDRGDSFDIGLESGVTNAWQQNLNEANAPSWLDLYSVIQQCNMLLKYAPTINYPDESERNRAMAETLVIRAYVYFTLVRTFGDVPLELEPTESDSKPALGRSPATEVMTQLLADINQAIDWFPEDNVVDKSTVSKPAAYALKADALLWKAKVLEGGSADLEATLMALDKATAMVSPLANYAAIFATDNKQNAEILWSMYFERNEKSDHYGSRLKPRNIFVESAANASEIPYAVNGARSVYAPSAKLLAAFDAYPNDVRKAASVITAVSTAGNVIGVFDNKFRGTAYDDDRHFDNDIIVYRWGGLILMKAEALAALNRVQEAVEALNLVRERAGIGSYTGATDKTTVEKAILDESFKESYFELKRWPDLMRFHAGGTINVYDEVPNLSGQTLPLYFPIPRTQIDLNPALKQTPGYN